MWKSAPGPTHKGGISNLVLPKLYGQYGISKMVSLSIRRLKELNLCGLFQSGSASKLLEFAKNHKIAKRSFESESIWNLFLERL